MSGRHAFRCSLIAVGLAAVAAGANAQTDQAAPAQDAKAVASKGASLYAELYDRYLQSARRTDGNAGVSIGWMTSLGGDPRARQINDLVTVQVVENISAAGQADSTLAKASSAEAGVPKLFGLEKKLPSSIDPSSLASLSTDSKFTGGGTTTRTGQLTAMLTARVAEVLPNGDLVLEGAREIEINGDRQMIVLTGVVRPFDISPANVVLSSQVGQLSIRYFGNGLMKDNLKPGWLVRVLNKIF